MDTALPQKFPFILDTNLAKANCTGNRVCTSCDTVVLELSDTKASVPGIGLENIQNRRKLGSKVTLRHLKDSMFLYQLF